MTGLSGALLLAGCTEEPAPRPDPYAEALAVSFDGMEASGFYEPGDLVNLGSRGVTNLTGTPLTVVSLTVEAEGDDSYVAGIFLVPLDPEVDPDQNGPGVGLDFPPDFAAGLEARVPAGVVLEPFEEFGGRYELMVTLRPQQPGLWRLRAWVLTYEVGGERYVLELPDRSGIVVVADRSACDGLTPFVDEC
jgi:hypothetical protein